MLLPLETGVQSCFSLAQEGPVDVVYERRVCNAGEMGRRVEVEGAMGWCLKLQAAARTFGRFEEPSASSATVLALCSIVTLRLGTAGKR